MANNNNDRVGQYRQVNSNFQPLRRGRNQLNLPVVVEIGDDLVTRNEMQTQVTILQEQITAIQNQMREQERRETEFRAAINAHLVPLMQVVNPGVNVGMGENQG